MLFQFYARPDGQTGLHYISDRAERLFGIKADLDDFSERFIALVVPDHRKAFIQSVQCAIKDRVGWHYEGKLCKPSGEIIWFVGDAVPLRREREIVFNGIIQDITGRKQAENSLRLALREKETLLRELYHRAKNSMQVICSMMSLQSAYSGNAMVKKFANDMAARIQAMALVHQKLYQAHDLSRIGLDEYLRDLLNLLFRSYNVSPGVIELKMDLVPVAVLIDVAVPCGLIINELVTNSIKYAFPDGRQGVISLRLSTDQKGGIELEYADDGVGVAPDFDFRHRQSLGLQSIFALAEQQLQGKVDFSAGQGLECRIRFVNALDNPRV
ncbi:MAG: PAS domain-containing protein [Lentisphaerae bacterium]|nr:PAS domain-containing protein [Lentisphaerota bacterium]